MVVPFDRLVSLWTRGACGQGARYEVLRYYRYLAFEKLDESICLIAHLALMRQGWGLLWLNACFILFTLVNKS